MRTKSKTCLLSIKEQHLSLTKEVRHLIQTPLWQQLQLQVFYECYAAAGFGQFILLFLADPVKHRHIEWEVSISCHLHVSPTDVQWDLSLGFGC